MSRYQFVHHASMSSKESLVCSMWFCWPSRTKKDLTAGSTFAIRPACCTQINQQHLPVQLNIRTLIAFVSVFADKHQTLDRTERLNLAEQDPRSLKTMASKNFGYMYKLNNQHFEGFVVWNTQTPLNTWCNNDNLSLQITEKNHHQMPAQFRISRNPATGQGTLCVQTQPFHQRQVAFPIHLLSKKQHQLRNLSWIDAKTCSALM